METKQERTMYKIVFGPPLLMAFTEVLFRIQDGNTTLEIVMNVTGAVLQDDGETFNFQGNIADREGIFAGWYRPEKQTGGIWLD